MTYTFNGTLNELEKTVLEQATTHKKDIVVFRENSHLLRIGFHRLGHNGGRFWIVAVEETDQSVTLSGKVKDIYNNRLYSNSKEIINNICIYITGYLVLSFFPTMIWLTVFQFTHIWIPLIAPLFILIFTHFRNRRYDAQLDKDFFDFISLFMTRQ